MGEINVKIALLEEKISKLTTLKETCSDIEMYDDEVVGAGQCTEIIKDIRGEYKNVKEAVLSLLSNSIGFFSGVKESLIMADEKAKNKISKDGDNV